MVVDEAWFAKLELPNHAAILRGLVDRARAEPAIRFVEVCCSIARGAADELSDLDVGLGLRTEDWPAVDRIVPPILGRLGEIVDQLEHSISEWGDVPHRRFFVQYVSGVQLDLVTFLASRRTGLPAGALALYDPDARLALPMEARVERATPADINDWAFLGWVALGDLDKYVRRGSPWEALARLNEARTYAWQLWAAAQGIAYPAFGLTSVLDQPGSAIPAAFADTTASLDLADLHRAALALAELLAEVSEHAAAATGAALPSSIRRHVEARLSRLGLLGRMPG
jgi:hypothetical protein